MTSRTRSMSLPPGSGSRTLPRVVVRRDRATIPTEQATEQVTIARHESVRAIGECGERLGEDGERRRERQLPEQRSCGRAARADPAVGRDEVPRGRPSLGRHVREEAFALGRPHRDGAEPVVAVPREDPVGRPAAEPAVLVVDQGGALVDPHLPIVAPRGLCDDGWMRLTERPSPRVAALVDGVGLLAFVVIGTADHGASLRSGEIARTAVPLLASWFAAAAAFALYRRPERWRLVASWAAAIPVAAVARSSVRGGPWDERLAIFAGVALGFTALFVLGARVLLGAVIRRRQEPSPSARRDASSDVTS